jgi:putative transposase
MRLQALKARPGRRRLAPDLGERLMADHRIVCSMSRSGNVWDNAAMEIFFLPLKSECTARKTFRTRDEAKVDVFDRVEPIYNAKRQHSIIGYRSPRSSRCRRD